MGNVDIRPTTLTIDQLVRLRYQAHHLSVSELLGISGVPGQVVTRNQGQGMEFHDLRHYVPGDEVRHIDWNATARSNQVQVRLQRAERERARTVVIDLSPQVFTGTGILTAVSLAITATLLLWHSAAQGDRITLAIFDGQDLVLSKTGMGEAGALSGIRSLTERFGLLSEAAKMSRAADLQPLTKWIAASSRRIGHVQLVSSLAGKDAWHSYLNVAHQRHSLQLYWIYDQFEDEVLPTGLYRFQNDQQVAELRLSGVTRKHLADSLGQERQRIRELLTKSGVSWFEFSDQRLLSKVRHTLPY